MSQYSSVEIVFKKEKNEINNEPYNVVYPLVFLLFFFRVFSKNCNKYRKKIHLSKHNDAIFALGLNAHI